MKSIQFPGWYYGPNGEAEQFNAIEEVPEGWLDHPAKFTGNKQTAPEPKTDKQPLTTRDIEKELSNKSMSELWGLAKKIDVTKDGKKPELVKRIADKLLILDNED